MFNQSAVTPQKICRIRHLEAQVVSLGSQPASTQSNLNAQDAEQAGNTGEGDEKSPRSDLAGLVGRLNVIDDGQLHYFDSQSSYNLVGEPLSRYSDVIELRSVTDEPS
ncbi:hypothetical protein CTA2_8294 [Colletotrichum tanaceti]|uniref:Uncharacterized protein n=1 Tax=Colletotrichum tanaceti TaxID=1306861 RepID=A0A4V6DH41_9PEZI|nr:hypothetical protein CTA2_8294 [Colletotrichum tanaceti]TKW55156.1 hypothetical protein CTA1_11967 [Colletotrichum tanaceti]